MHSTASVRAAPRACPQQDAQLADLATDDRLPCRRCASLRRRHPNPCPFRIGLLLHTARVSSTPREVARSVVRSSQRAVRRRDPMEADLDSKCAAAERPAARRARRCRATSSFQHHQEVPVASLRAEARGAIRRVAVGSSSLQAPRRCRGPSLCCLLPSWSSPALVVCWRAESKRKLKLRVKPSSRLLRGTHGACTSRYHRVWQRRLWSAQVRSDLDRIPSPNGTAPQHRWRGP